MISRKLVLFVFGNLLAIGVLVVSAGSIPVAKAGCGDNCWEIIYPKSVGSAETSTVGIAAVSPNDIWVVGSYQGTTGRQTLPEHWDGASWEVVSSPNSTDTNTILLAATAISTDDVWAVGISSGSAGQKTFTAHWDGYSWKSVPSPSIPGSSQNQLRGVSAVSYDDVWAVGNGITQTLTLHWNGLDWQRVPSYDVLTATQTILYRVAAVSDNDVWAVGQVSFGHEEAPSKTQTLIEHWHDNHWERVISPNVPDAGSQLSAVTAISANDVWAVGYSAHSTGRKTLTEHWDGNTWKIVDSPNVCLGENLFDGTAALSANDAWAVGTVSGDGAPEQMLTERWDGTAWNVVYAPNIENARHEFQAAVAIPNGFNGGDVWAVGGYQSPPGGLWHPLTMRYRVR